MTVRHTLVSISIGLFSSISIAQATEIPPTKHLMITPNCLLKNISSANIKTLSVTDSLSLLEVNDAGVNQLIAARQQQQKTPCGGFMDVTEDWNAYQSPQTWTQTQKSNNFLKNYAKNVAKPVDQVTLKPAYAIQYERQVGELLKKLNPQNMWNSLTTLSNFQDRYARSDNGVKAAKWLQTEVENMAATYGRKDISTYFVKTGPSYKQPSLVVKLGTQDVPGIVIGAHMDTLSGSFSKKPGADDDGTGTVTVLEVARTILESGMQFKKPIYFIWYAAEEEGLVGSGYVVKYFQNKNIPVDAVIHLDMTGYAYQNDPTIWLIDDYTNNDLTKFLETLINTYVKKPIDHTKCGYACSDHASWHQKGYKAAIPFEAKFGNDNPYIHTSRDTMEWLSLDHMTNYAQIGVAFAVELAEPTA